MDMATGFYRQPGYATVANTHAKPAFGWELQSSENEKKNGMCSPLTH